MTFVVAGRRGDTEFVPQLTVLTSVGLVLVSFGYLVVYNNRVAQAIQTNNVLPHIVENLYAAISELSQPRVIADGRRPGSADGRDGGGSACPLRRRRQAGAGGDERLYATDRP